MAWLVSAAYFVLPLVASIAPCFSAPQLCRPGQAVWHTAGTILPGCEQLQQSDRIPAESWSTGGGKEMPFHSRHEVSYQWPTQCCEWVSCTGLKKLPFISPVKDEELSTVSQAESCGVAVWSWRWISYNPKLVVFNLSCLCLIWDLLLGCSEQCAWAVPHSCSGMLLLYSLAA